LTVTKYVLKEDEAKHEHPIKDWVLGLDIEVGDDIRNGGVTFRAKLAHIATAELEPTADVAVGEQGPEGPQGAASTVPGPKGDAGGLAGHIAIGTDAISGDKDGSNKIFTLTNTPTGEPGIFYNGQLLTLDSDYTRIGTQITLVYVAPESYEVLSAIYPYA
jgi:hypothetical protein